MTNLSPVQHRVGTQNVKPAHQHDCERCTFLGTVRDDGVNPGCDLYTCDHTLGTGPVFIMRWSDRPGDNITAPVARLRDVQPDQFINEGYFKRLGLAMNLLVAKDILQEAYIPHGWVGK